MNLELITATEAHARELIRSLRVADRAEIVAAGSRPGQAVLASWRDAVIRRAALVDGEVAAIWGVSGSLLGGVGVPWLLTGSPCERVLPLQFARIYRAEVVSMLGLFTRLENFVDATYIGAIRMLILAGFRLDDPAPYGPRGALFCRFEMRAPK
jgi:hypothetical protein